MPWVRSSAGNGNDEGVGGLVGLLVSGSIQNSYSTGAVITGSSTTDVGGFVGNNLGGTIASSYFDMDTSGQSLAVGTDANTKAPMFTGLPQPRNIQDVIPSGFSARTWGTGVGLYPYLLWQGTPQVIAGFVNDSHRRGR